MASFIIDILHPAHVHFFRPAIAELQRAGHRVDVVARDKDITLELLTRYGIGHEVISREGATGRALELARRSRLLWQRVRRQRPAALASIGGVSTAPVGFLTRTRNYIFYDTESARLSNLISYPFATQVLTPACYRGRVWGRHETYRGYHELAYLHPRRFQSDPRRLRDEGLDPAEPYAVLRFVSGKALHDLGLRVLAPPERERLVQALSPRLRLHISSESPLPPQLERHRLRLRSDLMHDLLAGAQIFIGESATMASESVILGTPAIYLDARGRSYTDEQERRYGLGRTFHPRELDAAIGCAQDFLDRDRKQNPAFRTGLARMLAETQDVTALVVEKMLGNRRRLGVLS